MKIDAAERIKASIEDYRSFDEQLAEARASGRKFGTATDTKGRRAVYYFTDEEAAHMAGYKVIRRKKPWRAELDALRAELEALKKK